MQLLDIFSGAGGAARGYMDAGFDVVGVDIADQPNYPALFLRGDALAVLQAVGFVSQFDAVHASPPCQAYSTVTADKASHRRLIAVVRDLLRQAQVPYVIENVEGAAKDLEEPFRICGSALGLDLRRHRYFEANWPCVGLPCNHTWQLPRFRTLDIGRHRRGEKATVVGVHGKMNYAGEPELRRAAMGIDWMTDQELTQAVPPSYTEHIGNQLHAFIRAGAGEPA